MDTARQVVRWALPGWMMLLFWSIFIAVNAFMGGQDSALYISILKKTAEFIVPLSVIAIPLGFIVYQIYYWVYWYVPIPSIAKKNLMNPVDRGKEILSGVKDHIDFKEVFDNPLNDTPQNAFEQWGPFHFKSTAVMQKYRQNWHLSESAWYLALSDNKYANTAEFLEKRNQFLGDIYHSLGACYHALFLAAIGYFLFILSEFVDIISLSPAGTIHIFIPLVVNSVIFLLVFSIFRAGRMASFDALLALKHDVITNVMLDRPIGH